MQAGCRPLSPLGAPSVRLQVPQPARAGVKGLQERRGGQGGGKAAGRAFALRVTMATSHDVDGAARGQNREVGRTQETGRKIVNSHCGEVSNNGSANKMDPPQEEETARDPQKRDWEKNRNKQQTC